ncbi:hypothetical protein D9M71_735940 [compost metagenome]
MPFAVQQIRTIQTVARLLARADRPWMRTDPVSRRDDWAFIKDAVLGCGDGLWRNVRNRNNTSTVHLCLPHRILMDIVARLLD